MSNKFLVIIPFEYLGPGLTPGHKKDFYFVIQSLRDKGFVVEVLYSKSNAVYSDVGHIQLFCLTDILDNLRYCNYTVIIGPAHRFRSSLFRKRRELIYYVFDSILKTSIFAFLNNPLLFYRVVYALIVEVLLRKYKIIVSSLEEYTWFTSTRHKMSNVNIILPPVDYIQCANSSDPNTDIKKILIYNPPVDSEQFVFDLLCKISLENIDCEITITGNGLNDFRGKFNNFLNVNFCGYVDDIVSIILDSTLVLLTDVSGSGFCNRAAQVRSLGVPLLCTFPSVRGTGLFLDDGVFIMFSPDQGVDFIKKNIISLNKNHSILSKNLRSFFDSNVDHISSVK